jgi:hypothetical protein
MPHAREHHARERPAGRERDDATHAPSANVAAMRETI